MVLPAEGEVGVSHLLAGRQSRLEPAFEPLQLDPRRTGVIPFRVGSYSRLSPRASASAIGIRVDEGENLGKGLLQYICRRPSYAPGLWTRQSRLFI